MNTLEKRRKPYPNTIACPVKSRIKAIDKAFVIFNEELGVLFRNKEPSSLKIHSLKSDIEALEYIKSRLVEQVKKQV